MPDEKEFNASQNNEAPPLSTAPKAAPSAEEEHPPTAAASSLSKSELTAAYNKLQAEKQELFDRLLRKQAELENLRKRVEREKQDFLQHATADLIRALLPTVDSLERALKHRDDKIPGQFYEGLKLIHRELLEVLERAGVTVIPTEGMLFDPHVHQAVETVVSPEHRDHEIVEELQRGYKLRQRLLRPAVVKVAIHPGSASESSRSQG